MQMNNMNNDLQQYVSELSQNVRGLDQNDNSFEKITNHGNTGMDKHNSQILKTEN